MRFEHGLLQQRVGEVISGSEWVSRTWPNAVTEMEPMASHERLITHM